MYSDFCLGRTLRYWRDLIHICFVSYFIIGMSKLLTAFPTLLWTFHRWLYGTAGTARCSLKRISTKTLSTNVCRAHYFCIYSLSSAGTECKKNTIFFQKQLPYQGQNHSERLTAENDRRFNTSEGEKGSAIICFEFRLKPLTTREKVTLPAR